MYSEWEKGRNYFKILTGESIGKRLLGRSSHRLEDNNIMYLKDTGLCMRNWIDSAQE